MGGRFRRQSGCSIAMSETLRVASYNVRVAVDDGLDAWEQRVDDVASTIRFHDPDLIGLQEPRGHQLEDLRERLPTYEWLGVGRRGGEEGEFSPVGYRPRRFDLEDSKTFWLSETPGEVGSVGWDAELPRIATWGRFRDRETDKHLIHANTHFDHVGGRAREESASLLADHLPTVTSDHEAIVLTGDFNCEPNSAPYERLVDNDNIDLRDARKHAEHGHHGPEHTVTGFEDPQTGRRIDYVFVTPDVNIAQYATCVDLRSTGRVPSDHLPVVADLQFS